MTTISPPEVTLACRTCGNDGMEDSSPIAGDVWLCRTCASRLSNPQLRELRDRTTHHHPQSGEARLEMPDIQPDRTDYQELTCRTSWETHLPPCPQGQFMLRMDFCIDTGDTARIITDHRRGRLVAATYQVEEETACFLPQESGEIRRVSQRYLQDSLERLNPQGEPAWHQPLTPGGFTSQEPHNPLGVQHTPSFSRMLADHEWHPPNPSGKPRLLACSTCLARMQLTTDRKGNVTSARVRLPLERECYYTVRQNRLSPAADQQHYRQPPPVTPKRAAPRTNRRQRG